MGNISGTWAILREDITTIHSIIIAGRGRALTTGCAIEKELVSIAYHIHVRHPTLTIILAATSQNPPLLQFHGIAPKHSFWCIHYPISIVRYSRHRTIQSISYDTIDIVLFNRHRCTIESTLDAFYDRGSTFPLQCFLNDGVIYPKIVGMLIFLRKMIF